jgi:hypothetical protein
MIFDCGVLITASYLGDEWKAKPEERAMMIDCYARYANYRGWLAGASPEAAVILVTITYMMPRVLTQKFFDKMKELTGHAHANNRTPGIRENIARESHRPPGGAGGSRSDHSGPAPIGGMGGTVEISDLNRKLDNGSGKKPV